MPSLRKITGFLKLEHTLFSLPLLFAGAALALQDQGQRLWSLGWARAAWLVLAGVGARTCALALNRLLDRRLDAKNPRTAGRELPSGKLKPWHGWVLALAGLLLYIMAAWSLGTWCLILAPLPIAVFVIYPLMKRFTFLAHWGVGLGLGLAPLGGWVGTANRFPDSPAIWLLGGFALCWVAGFDLIYATQDEAFDRAQGLHSVPARFGAQAAVKAGAWMHGFALACLAGLLAAAFRPHPAAALAGLLPVAGLLAAEQKLGSSLEPQAAFFQVNAWIGFFVLAFVLLGSGHLAW